MKSLDRLRRGRPDKGHHPNCSTDTEPVIISSSFQPPKQPWWNRFCCVVFNMGVDKIRTDKEQT